MATKKHGHCKENRWENVCSNTLFGWWRRLTGFTGSASKSDAMLRTAL